MKVFTNCKKDEEQKKLAVYIYNIISYIYILKKLIYLVNDILYKSKLE